MTPRNIFDVAIITAGTGGWLIDMLPPFAAGVTIVLCCIRIWQELWGKRR